MAGPLAGLGRASWKAHAWTSLSRQKGVACGVGVRERLHSHTGRKYKVKDGHRAPAPGNPGYRSESYDASACESPVV